MAIFMYIYASLPARVVLGEGVDSLSMSRDTIFYLSIILVSLVNVLVFVVRGLPGERNDQFSTWFFGQIILLNFFFCTSLGLINVLNSGEKFAIENLGIVIYGSIVLIVLWAIGWPVYAFFRKFLNKQEV